MQTNSSRIIFFCTILTFGIIPESQAVTFDSDGIPVTQMKLPDGSNMRFVMDVDLNGYPDSADPYYTYKGFAVGLNGNYYLRQMGDVNGDGSADIVAFGKRGVYVSLYDLDENKFKQPQLWLRAFGDLEGGWDVTKHLRLLADVDGDGKADIVGFYDDGVYVALADPYTDKFREPEKWSEEFGHNESWVLDKHRRMMADVNGDGCADIVGFDSSGVQVAIAQPDGSFSDSDNWTTEFGDSHDPGVNIIKHPCFVADVNADGQADIIFFGDDDVRVGISNGETFNVSKWSNQFGYNDGWDNTKPRIMADVNGDGRADIVGFDHANTKVAYAKKSGKKKGGKFNNSKLLNRHFGNMDTADENAAAAGRKWISPSNIRVLADANGDGKADIVGFGNNGIVVKLSNVTPPRATEWISDFSFANGYRTVKHPRLLAYLNDDNKIDVIGFKDEYVEGAMSSPGDSEFKTATELSSQFGYAEVAGKWQPDNKVYGDQALPLTLIVINDMHFSRNINNLRKMFPEIMDNVTNTSKYGSWNGEWPQASNNWVSGSDAASDGIATYQYQNRYFSRPFGIIMNGDLAETNGNNYEEFKKAFHYNYDNPGSGIDQEYFIFPGIGNHDLYRAAMHKITGCTNNYYAYKGINYLIDAFEDKRWNYDPTRLVLKKPLQYEYENTAIIGADLYKGSFMYSFDIGPFHLVQLHDCLGSNDNVTFTEPCSTPPKTPKKVEINRCYDDLENDLAEYAKDGKKVIINMHTPPGSTAKDPKRITRTDELTGTFFNDTPADGDIYNVNVIGIFSGHQVNCAYSAVSGSVDPADYEDMADPGLRSYDNEGRKCLKGLYKENVYDNDWTVKHEYPSGTVYDIPSYYSHNLKFKWNLPGRLPATFLLVELNEEYMTVGVVEYEIDSNGSTELSNMKWYDETSPKFLSTPFHEH
ncbi:MAG: hypothetical protein D3924_06055 [Candidatus Electrothrix sp. AR4]|nr:hypothetical protein [Candidatus Electrothrix sp. AR4]